MMALAKLKDAMRTHGFWLWLAVMATLCSAPLWLSD